MTMTMSMNTNMSMSTGIITTIMATMRDEVFVSLGIETTHKFSAGASACKRA